MRPPACSCQTCAKRDKCPSCGTRVMQAAFAWAFGSSAIAECDDYQEDRYHGIDGVISHAF